MWDVGIEHLLARSLAEVGDVGDDGDDGDGYSVLGSFPNEFRRGKHRKTPSIERTKHFRPISDIRNKKQSKRETEANGSKWGTREQTEANRSKFLAAVTPNAALSLLLL